MDQAGPYSMRNLRNTSLMCLPLEEWTIYSGLYRVDNRVDSIHASKGCVAVAPGLKFAISNFKKQKQNRKK